MVENPESNLISRVEDTRPWRMEPCPPEEKPKTDRENTKSVELEQTRTNSDTAKMQGNDCKDSMKYEEWSKSNELEQTLTPNIPPRDDSRTEENEESESRPKRQKVVVNESRAAASGSPGASAP